MVFSRCRVRTKRPILPPEPSMRATDGGCGAGRPSSSATTTTARRDARDVDFDDDDFDDDDDDDARGARRVRANERWGGRASRVGARRARG
jgi:hypothetical protein